ncbi:MAG: hypothetical protein ACHQ7N_10290 [Candidatus Methylomirabilales bacterium]
MEGKRAGARRTACWQALIFVAFGLTAPLALTFVLLRRGPELSWIGFGFAELIHHQTLGWLRERQMAGGET